MAVQVVEPLGPYARREKACFGEVETLEETAAHAGPLGVHGEPQRREVAAR